MPKPSTIQPEPDTSTPSIEEFLTEEFIEMVSYVERFHATHGESPTDKEMLKRFNVAEALLEEFKVHPLVFKSLTGRGITYPPRKDYLNERQLSSVAVMTNYTDRRSDEKKLRDIGVTTREWATWMLDNNFIGYLQERSERMFQHAQHEAHLGLIKGMRNGNVASVKLFNEMSGRHNPEADNVFNVRLLLHGIIEVLQGEIKDPIALHRIAGKIMNLATAEVTGGTPRSNTVVLVPQKEIEMSGEV